MIGGILKKLLGDKSAKDRKELQPIVDKVAAEYATLQGLSNDELRQKTKDLQKEISDYISAEESKIAELKLEAEKPETTVEAKEEMYDEIDKISEVVDKKIEEVLQKILPAGFAVVKETARRLSEGPITVTATDMDRELAEMGKDFISMDGDKATYANSWDAAGSKIEWNMVHYDVQLMGGAILHKGNIAEMMTGEGKTLVATLPVFLNALAGKGVHVVTVNNYLARRDSEWMGPIYQFHGLSVDCIDNHRPNSETRRKAYAANITFGTNNEFGFDYLRDNMVNDPAQLVQKKHHYAIIDEVDSVLIDDARTPLIISGPTPQGDKHEFDVYKPKIEKLFNAQKRLVNGFLTDAKKLLAESEKEDLAKKEATQLGKDGGLALLRSFRGLPKNKALIKYLSEDGIRATLQKTENFYMQDQEKEMPNVDKELYFVIDEKNNTIDLTEKGIDLIAEGEDPNFYIMPDMGAEISSIEKMSISAEEKTKKKDILIRDFTVKTERIHTINQLLKAYTLFEKEVDYVLMDGKVKIVDEQTGRIMEGRRYSDGLHQAIESKENVKIEAATQTYATVTLQNYFRMYHKLSGMTGTAETEAQEFFDIYKLDVTVVPTNRPVIRKDGNDMVYKTAREKYNAIIERIEELRGQGRPVLVGTTTVEISEKLSRMLKMKKIDHQVLNAKYHQQEAEIVANAGLPGQVTIATNMAGRGTDIKLGDGVKDAGGLAIIGCERHDSRRVDRQLRGRSGRQGDPGSSEFYVSLEDNLMRLFGSERIARMMDRLGIKEGEVIQHSMITKSIERAQKKVEENNFGIRKRLLEYDDVMNAQRNAIYKRRKNALYGDRLEVDIINMFYETLTGIIEEHQEYRDIDGFKLDLLRTFALESPFDTEDELVEADPQALADELFAKVMENYKRKWEELSDEAFVVFKNIYENEFDGSKNLISVPLTDGIKVITMPVDIEKSYNQQCKNLKKELEKGISLMVIDLEWKEHLREMDDLRQSVQQARYEQKDPLLVYKLESFDLFKKMMDRVNRDIVSFLIKARIHVQQQEAAPVVIKAKKEEDPLANVQTSKTEVPQYAGGGGAPEGGEQQAQQQERPKQAPVVRQDKKIGRNDKVTIFNVMSGEKKEVKFKVAEPMIQSGQWRIIEN